ncbi:MAG: DUF2804 domain-containing protein [Deltaproteobacteria bacterium]|nr:DUF2804 domain-containing protein [Kofleriaceae bacterium]
MSLAPPPTRLVEDGHQHLGRFRGPAERNNLIDAAYRSWPRALRWWRLKEWQAVQIASPRLFANLALFDARVMQLRQVKVYDRARGVKHIHERKLPPRSLRIADQLLDSVNRHEDRTGMLAFTNRVAQGRIEVACELAATRDAPRVAGQLTLHTDRGASQVVSLPFAKGGMYSHKGMFPVEGELTIGDERVTLRPDDTLALLDDHKGYYPYVMRWDWVTCATWQGGLALGFNLTRNQCRDPQQHNENCAWRGDRIGVLPAIEVTRVNVGEPDEQWFFRDRDGKVDVRFTPTVPGDVRVNALVVESRYRGPFGTFAGRLEPEGLAPIVVDGWFGMGEDFHLRC